MLINLWVRDKSSGNVHQVGTDVHDSVEYLNGQVVYVNVQNGCGTLDEYEWIESPDFDDYISVTPEQLLLNRELFRKDIIAMLEKDCCEDCCHRDDDGGYCLECYNGNKKER